MRMMDVEQAINVLKNLDQHIQEKHINRIRKARDVLIDSYREMKADRDRLKLERDELQHMHVL